MKKELMEIFEKFYYFFYKNLIKKIIFTMKKEIISIEIN